jgi:hypothetical protein
LGGIYFLVDNGDTLEIHLSAIIDMRDYGYLDFGQKKGKT